MIYRVKSFLQINENHCVKSFLQINENHSGQQTGIRACRCFIRQVWKSSICWVVLAEPTIVHKIFQTNSSFHAKIFWQLVKQLAYTMFISNNRAPFHLWWKENLVKQKKVSKYYENDCLQIFLLLFMSLLTAKFVKKARIYFILLKKRLKINLKFFKYQISTSVKRSEKQLPSKANFRPFFQLNYS